MKKAASCENILAEITATFEVRDTFGTCYQFGHLIVTDRCVKLITKYLPGWTETRVIHYADIARIDSARSVFELFNEESIRVTLVNKGNAANFFEMLKQFAVHAPGIRSFHQNSAGF